MIFAIDPGPTESAFVQLRDDRPLEFGKIANDRMLDLLEASKLWPHLAIEMIASFGMPVGAEIFSTCVWIGRFIQAWNGPYTLVYRRDVKLHLCGQARAKDGNIRQALIDRWGGKAKAIGNKKQPGPLYGISADVWSALSVAVTFSDREVTS